MNLRKLYEVEQYYKKLAQILDSQFALEREAVNAEINSLKEQLVLINAQIGELGLVGNMSKEFLDRHSEIKGEIDALREQNKAYLLQKKVYRKQKLRLMKF